MNLTINILSIFSKLALKDVEGNFYTTFLQEHNIFKNEY
jgi:hypothetical protein